MINNKPKPGDVVRLYLDKNKEEYQAMVVQPCGNKLLILGSNNDDLNNNRSKEWDIIDGDKFHPLTDEIDCSQWNLVMGNTP